MKLYTYFRSSASFGVRIALNLKGLTYETVPVHLLKGGGEQLKPEFAAVNPQQLLLALQTDDGERPGQSLAVLEYLDEAYPQVPLLPASPAERAHVRSLALWIACEIHPLNNLRTLRYLVRTLNVGEEAKNAWYKHWVEVGLKQLETVLAASPKTGKFCYGDTPTIADCCLVPQVFNGQRFERDFSAMPTVVRIHEQCMSLEASKQAAPAAQPDAE